MQEIGKVVAINGDIAVVRFSRQASCKNCNLCGFKKNDTHVDLRVKNEFNATVDDLVNVEMRDSAVLIACFAVYLIPIIFALAGLLIGLIFDKLLLELAFSLGFLVLSFILVILVDKKFKFTRLFVAKMIGIMSDTQQIQSKEQI